MNCKSCNYPLWNIKQRKCPECGTPFKVSEYLFTINSVQFRCPHCEQPYYGTNPLNGHLVPPAFSCVRCRNNVTMDDMILLPTEGIQEELTAAGDHPWIRRRGSTFVAWFRTLIASCFTPRNLISLTPLDSPARSAFSFFIFTLFLTLLTGVGALFAFVLFTAYGMRGPSAAKISELVLGASVPILGILAGAMIWFLTIHGIIAITGQNRGLNRTFQTFCFASGPLVLAGVPCLGLHLSPFAILWWAINISVVLPKAHGISALRSVAAALFLPVLCVFGVLALILVATLNFNRSTAVTPPAPVVQQSAAPPASAPDPSANPQPTPDPAEQPGTPR